MHRQHYKVEAAVAVKINQSRRIGPAARTRTKRVWQMEIPLAIAQKNSKVFRAGLRAVAAHHEIGMAVAVQIANGHPARLLTNEPGRMSGKMAVAVTEVDLDRPGWRVSSQVIKSAVTVDVSQRGVPSGQPLHRSNGHDRRKVTAVAVSEEDLHIVGAVRQPGGYNDVGFAIAVNIAGHDRFCFSDGG